MDHACALLLFIMMMGLHPHVFPAHINACLVNQPAPTVQTVLQPLIGIFRGIHVYVRMVTMMMGQLSVLVVIIHASNAQMIVPVIAATTH